MAGDVKLVKKLQDDRGYVFTKDGVYFTLNEEQFKQLQALFEKIADDTV